MVRALTCFAGLLGTKHNCSRLFSAVSEEKTSPGEAVGAAKVSPLSDPSLGPRVRVVEMPRQICTR